MSFEEWLGQHGYTPRYDEGGLLRGYTDPGGNFLSSSGEGNFDQLQALYQGDQRVDQNGLAGFGTAGYVGQNSPITIGGQTYGQVGDASRDGLTVTYDPTYGNIAPLSQLGPIWQQQAAKTSADNANDLFQYAPLIMGALAMGGIGAAEAGFGGLSSPSLIGAEGAAGAGELGSTLTTLDALGGTGGGGNLLNVAADVGAGGGAGSGSIWDSLYSMYGPGSGFSSAAELAPVISTAAPEVAAGLSGLQTAGLAGAGAAGAATLGSAFNGNIADLNSIIGPQTAPGQSLMQQNLAPDFPGAQTPLNGGITGLSPTDAILTGGATGAGAIAGLGTGAANVAGTSWLNTLLNGLRSATSGSSGSSGASTGGSLLSRLLSGDAGAGDLASLLGALGSAGLGYAGAQAQTNALKDMQDKYLALGAPFRSRLASSYEPGFNMATADPAFQGALDQSSNAILRGLSTQGNPYDNPGGLMQAQKYVTQNVALPQLNTYRSQLGSFGQLGTNQAGTAGMGAAQAAGGTYDALGAGLAGLTQPQNDLSSILRQLGGANGLRLNSGSGF